MSSKSEILENAREVAKRAEELVAYLEKNNFEEPSFKATSSVVPNNPEYDELRISVSNASQNLIHLVNGPLNWLRELFCMHYDFAAWQVALDFEYFKAVPLEGSIKLSEIAKTVGMDEERTGRILRLLATQKTFYEIEPDVFQHTAVSALIAKDHSIHAVLAMQADEMFKASVETTACFREAPFDSDTKITPFKFRHGLPAYAWYTANPEKGARFALAMAGVTKMDRQISELKDSFPWSSLTGTKIVDVGGGSGHISAYLASQYPQFNFVVQDISENMLAQASKDGKLEGVGDRITFMQHDFFQSQPIHDATAFFLRQITHNYNDIDTIRLFRGFVPAMEKCAPGTPLLVNDTVLPEANEKPAFEEHTLRQVDICMLVGYGAKQRTPKEFLKLLKEADERFIIAKIHATGSMGLIEVHLQQ